MKLKNTDPRIDSVVTKSLQKLSNEGGYDPSLLPFPASATASACKKISNGGNVLHELLVKTGVHFRDDDIKRSYNLTEHEGAFGMLIGDREFGVYQTAPQCTATARIIAEIARQANLSRKTRKYSAGRPARFEVVLDAMDKIADAIGPLADYLRFQMDVDMAAAVILENYERVDELFDATGKCNKDLLFSEAARYSVVRSDGPIQTMEVIKDAKPAHIVRAVRNSKTFDFSVGSVAIHDQPFMTSLARQLEQQRQNASKSHCPIANNRIDLWMLLDLLNGPVAARRIHMDLHSVYPTNHLPYSDPQGR